MVRCGAYIHYFPFFFFFLINCSLNVVPDDDDDDNDDIDFQSITCKFTHVSVRSLVLGCNPLLPAWLKLQTLYCYLKKLLKLWQGNNTDQTDKDLHQLQAVSKFAVLAEAALESAPQFIIQLYAMAVQQESVTIVQMVSLPVSFLSIVWASTVADGLTQTDLGDLIFSMKDRVLLFVTHLFILSSRLFAVALFTVSYKWWVISVLILHCTVITICDRVWLCAAQRDDILDRCVSVILFCLHWLRDDLSLIGGYDGDKQLRMTLISNVLFVIENITLILLFYFSHFPHTWYSLPVTICVCLFAVLGAVIRLTHFHFLKKDSDDQSNNTDQV